MTPQSTHHPITPRNKRRVTRRRDPRANTPLVVGKSLLTENQRLAMAFKDAKPDPTLDKIFENINAARTAEKQKALNEGLPWD